MSLSKGAMPLASSRDQIESKAAEGTIRFGWPVCAGTDKSRQCKEYDGAGKILGVSIIDPGKGYGPDEGGGVDTEYPDHTAAAYLVKGYVEMESGQKTIAAGGQLALLDATLEDPDTPPTLAEHGSGTNPPAFSATTKIGYTWLGPWEDGETEAESALIASEVMACNGLTNYLDVTIPGRTAVPQGTTYCQLYYSADGGATWHQLSAHKIAYASLTNAATHVEPIKTADDDVNTTHAPAESPEYLEVGALVADDCTLDKTVFENTRIEQGCTTAGTAVLVELNLP